LEDLVSIIEMSDHEPDSSNIENQISAAVRDQSAKEKRVKRYSDVKNVRCGQEEVQSFGTSDNLDDTQLNGPTMPSWNEAWAFLDHARSLCVDSPQTYYDFLDLMKSFKVGNIDNLGFIQGTIDLFSNHPILLLEFNSFLPPRFRITVHKETGYVVVIMLTGTLEASKENRGRVPKRYLTPVLINQATSQPDILTQGTSKKRKLAKSKQFQKTTREEETFDLINGRLE